MAQGKPWYSMVVLLAVAGTSLHADEVGTSVPGGEKGFLPGAGTTTPTGPGSRDLILKPGTPTAQQGLGSTQANPSLLAVPTPSASHGSSIIPSEACAPAHGQACAGPFAPNMFGGGFGGPGLSYAGPVLAPGALNGLDLEILLRNGRFFPTATGFRYQVGQAGAGPATLLTPFGNFTIPLLTGTRFTQTITSQVPGTTFTPSALALLQALSTTPGQPLYQLIVGLENSLNPLGTVRQIGVNAPSGVLESGTAANRFNLLYTYIVNDYISTPVALNLPSPSATNVVGRIKVSDDNNPLPRDRFIFEYDYLNGVPLSSTKQTVNRFVLGGELAFFDNLFSVEVRAPFASTGKTDIIADGVTGSDFEFGNVHLAAKCLLLRGDVLNVSAGLGIDVPTGDDIRIHAGDLAPSIRVRNDACLLTPYLAVLYTPNKNLFAQGWYQVVIPTSANDVQVDTNLLGDTRFTIPTFTGTIIPRGAITANPPNPPANVTAPIGLYDYDIFSTIGSLRDQVLMQFDFQLGYWLLSSEDPSALLRGLAPFVELHYDTTVDNAKTLSVGGLTFTNRLNHFNELNLTAGLVSQIKDNVHLSTGLVVPLLKNEYRSMDWQFGVRANIFFGPRGCDGARGALANLF